MDIEVKVKNCTFSTGYCFGNLFLLQMRQR